MTKALAKKLFYFRTKTNTYTFTVSVPGPTGPMLASAIMYLMKNGQAADKSKTAVQAILDQARATGWKYNGH